MKAHILALPLMGLMVASGPVRAEMVACAAPGISVEVALARWEKNRFLVRGWYPVPAGTCQTLIELPLHKGKYYHFARQSGGERVWPVQSEPHRALCVRLETKFVFRVRASLGGRCPTGFVVRRFAVHVPENGRLRLTFAK